MCMAISSKILCLLLFCASTVYGEEIRLIYKVGEIADIVTELQTDLDVKVGDEDEMSARGLETTEAEIKVIGSTPYVDQMPLTLAYKLKSYKTQLEQAGETTIFDIDSPSTNYLYAEIKQLKGKEALITLKDPRKGFEPKETNNPLSEILSAKKVSYLILSRLREVFSLVGQPLIVGKTIDIPITFGENATQEGFLSYKVTRITDDRVETDITFSLPRQRKEAGAILVSSGSMTGKGIFNRRNALNFNIYLKGQFGSSIKPEDKSAQTQSIDVTLRVNGLTRV